MDVLWNIRTGDVIDLETIDPQSIDPQWYWGVGPRAKAHLLYADYRGTLCGLQDCTFDTPPDDDLDCRCKTCQRVLGKLQPTPAQPGA